MKHYPVPEHLNMPKVHTGRKGGKKVISPQGRSEIEMMFDSRRGIKVKDHDKEVRRKRAASADSKTTKKSRRKQNYDYDVVDRQFPLLTLPRVELSSKDRQCDFNKYPTSIPHDYRKYSASSGFDSSVYGRTMPLRYPTAGAAHHAHQRSQPKISVSSGRTEAQTSDSSGTDTSASSSHHLLRDSRGRKAESYRSRSCDRIPGSFSDSDTSSRSARAARAAAALDYSVSTFCPPKPSEVTVPGTVVRCNTLGSRPQHAGVQPYLNGRRSTLRRDIEIADEPEKPDPYSTFWHLKNFDSSLKREASIHSCGGFTLNGASKAKKEGWTRFCSSHKIAFVVSTFSVMVTIGLIITLLLMKKKGMMEAM